MISFVKHDVGTEALAKKLNEVIRIMNEGNPVPSFDKSVASNILVNLITAAYNEGYWYANNQDKPTADNKKRKEACYAELRGMLGL